MNEETRRCDLNGSCTYRFCSSNRAADQFAGQIALNGEAASEDVADEDSQVDMDQNRRS